MNFFLIGLAFSSWTGSKCFSFFIEQKALRFFEFQNQNTDGVWIGALFWILFCEVSPLLKKLKEDYLLSALSFLFLGYGILRLHCFQKGCCSGSPTHLLWAVQYGWGSAATYWWIPIHPVQIYCAIHGLVIAALLFFWHRKKNSRILLYLSLFYYSVGRGITDLFRADPQSLWLTDQSLTLHGGMMFAFLGVGVFGLCFYPVYLASFRSIGRWSSYFDSFWR